MDNYTHKNCFRKYSGSSTGMEEKLVVDGIKELFEKYEIEINEIVNDGYSRAYYALIENFDWYIKKWQCLNHLLKNSKGKLYDL